MKRSRYSIVESMIADSTVSMDSAYKSQLEKKLMDSFEGSYLNLFFFKMNKKLILGLVAVLGVGVISYLYSQQKSDLVAYDKVQTSIENSGDSGDSAMKIAVDEHESFSAAQKVLSFTPFKLSEVLDVQLAGVQTARSFDGSKSGYLYLTFARGGDSYFNITQGAVALSDFFKPEDPQEVDLFIDGENIVGYYVKYHNSDIDPNSEQALYDAVFAADSSLSFYKDGVLVDVSEYAGLSLSQLREIAQSLHK